MKSVLQSHLGNIELAIDLDDIGHKALVPGAAPRLTGRAYSSTMVEHNMGRWRNPCGTSSILAMDSSLVGPGGYGPLPRR